MNKSDYNIIIRVNDLKFFNKLLTNTVLIKVYRVSLFVNHY